MRYISICSGIEAATVAWQPLGWEAVAFAEIEPFPCAVLEHHYPNVPNLGDITKVDWRPYAGTVDLVVGGTPCQSFSVAGRREGMDGASGLVREYFRLLSEVHPRWFVWENVPGALSSNGGKDFAFILQQWHELGYYVSWRILDAQYCGVPQRRRRVFAVGYIGDWKRPVKVLFERDSLRGYPPPSRETGQADSAGTGKGIAGAVTNKWHKGSGGPAGDECYNLVCGTLAASGAGTSRPAGIGNELDFCVPVFGIDNEQNVSPAEKAIGPLMKDSPTGGGRPLPAVLIETGQGYWQPSAVAGTLRAEGENRPSRPSNIIFPKTPLVLKDREGKPGGGKGPLIGEDKSFKLSCNNEQTLFFQGVRRLTPTECERLQGFPDGWTDIPFRVKPAPDGARYKALGNSMAVPCMAWIGKRIQDVEDGI